MNNMPERQEKDNAGRAGSSPGVDPWGSNGNVSSGKDRPRVSVKRKRPSLSFTPGLLWRTNQRKPFMMEKSKVTAAPCKYIRLPLP
ncbi:MAG: hypothetical protein ABTB30_12615 [Clostridia bacterium]|jgi:hypothetical protein